MNTQTVIVVQPSDIIVKPNGNGGYELSYFGNKRWYTWTLKSIIPLYLTVALDTVVAQLNSIPILTTPLN